MKGMGMETTRPALESRWESLTPDSQKPVFQLVDASHPLEFYIGRNPSGDRLLLLVTPEKPGGFKPMRAVSIEVFEREDGRWSLLIGLANAELSHVFSLLCGDLVEAARNVSQPSKPLAFVVGRLALWQRLLERAGTGLLTDAEVRGLAGELVFLSACMIPIVGLLDAVRCWVGPLGADQDFQCPDAAWEVKTVRADLPRVRIASEMQMFSTVRTITLVAVRLDECNPSSAGIVFSLNTLVRSVRTHAARDFGAADLFEERLAASGFMNRPEYDEPLFRVPWIRMFDVRDGFPRLVPSALPTGVSAVRYEVALEACTPFLIRQMDDVRLTDET